MGRLVGEEAERLAQSLGAVATLLRDDAEKGLQLRQAATTKAAPVVAKAPLAVPRSPPPAAAVPPSRTASVEFSLPPEFAVQPREVAPVRQTATPSAAQPVATPAAAGDPQLQNFVRDADSLFRTGLPAASTAVLHHFILYALRLTD